MDERCSVYSVGSGWVQLGRAKLGPTLQSCNACVGQPAVACLVQEAARSNVNVALSQQCNPNISVNPT